MPYIITTRQREDRFAQHGETVLGAPTRRAVATLAEARAIGPLPDGSVIEVAPVDWADLPPVTEARKRYPYGSGKDAVLKDYNAAQA